MMDLSDVQIAYMEPQRVSTITDWLTHTPFAFVLTQWHPPEIIVELGTRTGVSYCAFCQAVQHLSLPTKCFAVDTWKGDEHAGFYSEAIFEEFSRYHEANYSTFSTLMRMTFDDALDCFSDGTIDLLHIDGLHHYEAVKHDFESWLPKLSKRGIVLFHDTFLKRDGFGVWRLVEELKASYPIFEFLHGCGLGVLALDPTLLDKRLSKLFDASPHETVIFRSFFSSLGRLVFAEHQMRLAESRLKELEPAFSECESKMHSMQNSWSWRLTYPLRLLYDRFSSATKERPS